MKTFIILATIFAASSAYVSDRFGLQSNTFSLERSRSYLPRALEQLRTSTEQVCRGYGDRVVDVLWPNASKCIIASTQEDQSICYNIKHNTKNCLKPITEMFHECVPEKINFVFPMVIDSVFSLYDAICSSTGEELIELARPCLIRQETIVKLKRMFNELQVDQKDWPADKDDFCKQINKFADVVQNSIDECPGAVTRRAASKLLNSVTYQCNARENEIDTRARIEVA